MLFKPEDVAPMVRLYSVPTLNFPSKSEREDLWGFPLISALAHTNTQVHQILSCVNA